MLHRCAKPAKALLLATSLIALPLPALAQQGPDEPLARDLLARLVGTNTAESGGSDTRGAVSLLVEALKGAGFTDADIATPGISDTLPSLVVRYRSPHPTAGPVLMMAHMDVVEALPSDWSYPPFELTEDDGWLYGRGVDDNKAGVAVLVANFIALKRQGFQPDRDLIVMLTADEESNGLSAQMLSNEHRDLIAADMALNTDGGSVNISDGRPLAFMLQTSEKVYATYAFTASDPGGHSSMPKANSPISQVARALVALEDYEFPINLNETSRGFFAQGNAIAPPQDHALMAAMAAWQPGDPDPAGLAAYPYYNSLSRTTCVATMLDGGHAENALPQTARATVNCRVLPSESADSVLQRLSALAAPFGVSVETTFPYAASPPSALEPGLVDTVTRLTARWFDGVPVVPELSTGATDGSFTRNAGIPTYGVGALMEDPEDTRIHGRDERVSIEAFHKMLGFWYDLTRAIAE